MLTVVVSLFLLPPAVDDPLAKVELGLRGALEMLAANGDFNEGQRLAPSQKIVSVSG